MDTNIAEILNWMILGDKGKCFRNAVHHLTPSAVGTHTICQMAEGWQVPGRELSSIHFASGFGGNVTARLKKRERTSFLDTLVDPGTLFSPVLSPPVSIINRFSAVTQPWCNGCCCKSFASSHLSLFLTPNKLIYSWHHGNSNTMEERQKKWKLTEVLKFMGSFTFHRIHKLHVLLWSAVILYTVYF